MQEDNLIDIEKVQKLLFEGFQYSEAANKKELILVMGNTGAGKSTLVNYLLGYRIVECRREDGYVYEAEGDAPAIIGHEVAAETIYAQSFADETRGLCYTDCPGFLGNREAAVCTVESISTELSVRFAKCVKRIIVVIPYEDITSTKAANLRDLTKTFVNLFRDPIKMVHSCIFVISKLQDVSKQKVPINTKGCLNKLIKFCVENIEKLSLNKHVKEIDGLTLEDYNLVHAYYSTMLKKFDEFIYLDLTDDKSREQIHERIQGVSNVSTNSGLISGFSSIVTYVSGNDNKSDMDVISYSDFNFSGFNPQRVHFDNALYDVAHQGIDIIDAVKQKYYELIQLIQEQKDLNTALPILAEQKKWYVTPEANRQPKSQQIEHYQALSREYQLQLKRARNELKDVTQRIIVLTDERNDLNQLTLVEYLSESYKGSVPWYKPLGWLEKKFDFDTKGIPIKNVVKYQEKGQLCDEKDDQKESGRYAITYQSNAYVNAHAEVTLQIGKNQHPANVKRIAEVKKVLKRLKEEKATLTDKISYLTHGIEHLAGEVVQLEAGLNHDITQMSDKAHKLQLKIEQTESRLVEVVQCIDTTQSTGKKFLSAYKDKEAQFDVIAKIAKLLSFSETARPYVDLFVERYTKIDDQYEKYQNAFDELQEDEYKNSRVIPERFQDPVTGKLMNDPMLTHHGCCFDNSSIVPLFKTVDTNKIECPVLDCSEMVTRDELKSHKKLKSEIANWHEKNAKKQNITPGVMRRLDVEQVVKSHGIIRLEQEIVMVDDALDAIEKEIEKLTSKKAHLQLSKDYFQRQLNTLKETKLADLAMTNDNWYRYEHMQILLQYYFGEKPDLRCRDCMDVYWNNANFDEDNLLYVLRAVASNQDPNQEIIPIHQGNNRWSAIFINKNESLPIIWYIDPFASDIPPGLFNSLQTVYPAIKRNDIRFNNRALEEEHDCGPWIIAALNVLVQSKGFSLVLDDFNLNAFRHEHKRILEKKYVVKSALSYSGSDSPNRNGFFKSNEKEEVPEKMRSFTAKREADKVNHEIVGPHWYSDEDVIALIKHYIKDEPAVDCLEPMLATNWKEHHNTKRHHNTLRDNLAQYNSQRAERLEKGEPVNDKVLMPVNLHKGHWALLYVIYSEDTIELPHIYYFDPKGNPPPQDLHNAILDASVFPDNDIITIGQRVQEDDYNCGPWVVEAAKSIVENGGIPEQDYDINSARIKHNEIINISRLSCSSSSVNNVMELSGPSSEPPPLPPRVHISNLI